MVNAEATMLASHSRHFVDHVEARFGDGRARVLLANHSTDRLILVIFRLEQSLVGGSTHLHCLLLFRMLSDYLICFHMPIVIFLDNVMIFCMMCTLRSV